LSCDPSGWYKIHQINCLYSKKKRKKKEEVYTFLLYINSKWEDRLYVWLFIIYIYIYPTIIVARPCDPNVGEAVAVLPAVNR
jgi:hypothetical protein